VSAGEIIAFLADSSLRREDESRVAGFEQEFASWIGGGEAVFTPSGRSALYFLLKALRYPPGSEVIVPGFTFQAVPAVVLLAGLRPVFADIDPATFEMTAESVEKVFSARTAAVVATHLFGRTCPAADIARLCTAKGIDLLEDCAQACGARIDYSAAVEPEKTGVRHRDEAPPGRTPPGGRTYAGSGGTAAFFTFGVTKNFTAFGSGIAYCRDKNLAAEVRAAVEKRPPVPKRKAGFSALTAAAMKAATGRGVFNTALEPILRLAVSRAEPGQPDPVHNLFREPPVPPGSPEAFEAGLRRPLGAHAAAGLRQLDTIEARTEKRRATGEALRSALERTGAAGLPAPPDPGGDHIYVSFPLLRENRFRFAALLRARGVDTSPGYMAACSREPSLGGAPGLCPAAERAADSIIHIPLFPSLTKIDIKQIAAAVFEADRRLGKEVPD